ncbi:hypothetical protein VT84_23975 [Gemmata sp. SH-PL17]|uniref:hypothetical protein n=1 Tax=Gemmata sp. SH-PL17 TaxID=1630693 RepID=UPI00078DB2EA|nr:hypothetical protein [Gemmata sp. SH-PL17]AMV27480.1 hypothetical protein VT84_23975 [Gemmata sp. SH-PL17]
MTEAQWLTSKSLAPMFPCVPGTVLSRKKILFSFGCARQVLGYGSDEFIHSFEEWATACGNVLDVMESLIDAADNDGARNQVLRAEVGHLLDLEGWDGMIKYFSPANPIRFAEDVAAECASCAGRLGEPPDEGVREHVVAEQLHFLRDIFGNPFRPVTFSPEWRTSAVVALAAQMYESRDFSAMPILGDALQDAGCDRADVLSHCRGPGPHVRGCWVVDLVLGKE